MTKPPYSGQGTPLPASLHEEGEWIIEDVFFLWFPTNPLSKRTKVCIIPKPDGYSMVGFNAALASVALSTTEADLRDANRKKQLEVSWVPGPIEKGQPSDVVTTYILTMPNGQQAAAPIRNVKIAGSA